MKIQSSNTKLVYNYNPSGSRSTCPECSHLRKKKEDKCVSWDDRNKRGHCHNCGTAFFEYVPHEPKQYIVPEWENKTELSDKAVKYFEGRMISQKTLIAMKVFTDRTYMPQFQAEAEVVCFPYFFKENLINIKYRGPNKSFKMVSGAELIFYNFDCVQENEEIIIVEGEIDALTFIQAGFKNTISVPNGANKNLEYLDTSIDYFNHVKKIYIATDQDTKGIELKQELARRFGPERCYVVSFKECKDANEYLLKYGDAVKDVIQDAKPIPIKGIIEAGSLYVSLRDYYENGITEGMKIGQSYIDEYITWETGWLATVTGIPSSGKSEFVDHIICRLNVLHGWKAAYFTPENFPFKFHYAKIFEKLIGKKYSKTKSTEQEWDMAYEHIKENFFYILDEEDFTIKQILDAAKVLVKTRGIKILVLDPYNKLEHKFTDSETQYISRFLDQLGRFAKMNDVLIFLVAHPTKLKKDKDGRLPVPTLYDINGSANFYNKTDYGLTVSRKRDSDGVMMTDVEVHIQKVRFKHMGKQGIIDLSYDNDLGRYTRGGSDKSNWLTDKDWTLDQQTFFDDDIAPRTGDLPY